MFQDWWTIRKLRRLRILLVILGIAMVGHSTEDVWPVNTLGNLLAIAAGIWIVGMALLWGPDSPRLRYQGRKRERAEAQAQDERRARLLDRDREPRRDED